MRFRSKLSDGSVCCFSHVTVCVEGFYVERGKVMYSSFWNSGSVSLCLKCRESFSLSRF